MFLVRRPSLIRHSLRIPHNPTSIFVRSFTSAQDGTPGLPAQDGVPRQPRPSPSAQDGTPRQLRSFSSPQDGGAPRQPRKPPPPKPIPESPSFYTTRPKFHDQIMHLERAIGRAHYFLKAQHLLPLPAFARESLPPLFPVWKDQLDMAGDFDTTMTMSRYRKVVKLLNQLNDYHRIATIGSCHILAEKIYHITSMFESNKKDAVLARGKRKKVKLDEHGRSYTVGKRKTSSARVWMIPVQAPKAELTPDELLGLPETEPTYSVTTTTILVNNLPINEYFVLPGDRERITRPLRVAGVLGKYNVFAIVRGGGTTGQSGALAHGISKGVVAHEPEFETFFRRAKLTRRDPRMVERKKTGLAKARKRYTWVKR